MCPYSSDMATTAHHEEPAMTTFDSKTHYANLEDARKVALAASIADPSRYFYIHELFGWYVCAEKRLNVFAPSDGTSIWGHTGTYWKNGKEKPFTKRQRIADQNATPIMH